jgi:hypothetical protein
LVVGVVARDESTLAPRLRQLSAKPALLGHLHAAAFSYRPLPQRTVSAAELVRQLLEHQEIRAVLHLVHDSRPAVGAGESSLFRGLAWIAPITATVPAAV